MASTQEGEFEQSVMWRISIRWKRNGIMFLFEGNTFWGHAAATDACEKIHKMRKQKNMSECNLAKFFVFSSSLCKCVSCGILIKKDEYIEAYRRPAREIVKRFRALVEADIWSHWIQHFHICSRCWQVLFQPFHLLKLIQLRHVLKG